MKRKISFQGFLLPFRKRSNKEIRSVNSPTDRSQSFWGWALLILWLLIFLLEKLKPFRF